MRRISDRFSALSPFPHFDGKNQAGTLQSRKIISHALVFQCQESFHLSFG